MEMKYQIKSKNTKKNNRIVEFKNMQSMTLLKPIFWYTKNRRCKPYFGTDGVI